MKERPTRIQRQRRKGWRMPPNTVSVCRPGKWGNPFVIVEHWQFFGIKDADKNTIAEFPTREEAVIASVEMYKKWLPWQIFLPFYELHGKNLACWCKVGEPCHADVLLEVVARC